MIAASIYLAYVIAGFAAWGAYLTLTEEEVSLSNMGWCVLLWPALAGILLGAWVTLKIKGRRK